jgi:hypothetical protein
MLTADPQPPCPEIIRKLRHICTILKYNITYKHDDTAGRAFQVDKVASVAHRLGGSLHGASQPPPPPETPPSKKVCYWCNRDTHLEAACFLAKFAPPYHTPGGPLSLKLIKQWAQNILEGEADGRVRPPGQARRLAATPPPPADFVDPYSVDDLRSDSDNQYDVTDLRFAN